MARTSTRGWKGCHMCKYYKDRAYGDPIRLPVNVLRKLGRTKRVTRHTITKDD